MASPLPSEALLFLALSLSPAKSQQAPTHSGGEESGRLTGLHSESCYKSSLQNTRPLAPLSALYLRIVQCMSE